MREQHAGMYIVPEGALDTDGKDRKTSPPKPTPYVPIYSLNSSEVSTIQYIHGCLHAHALPEAADNPQTFHQALLLIAAMARLAPDAILHNVMPVFTFMGSNVFHRDDTYSFRVVQKASATFP